MKQYSLFVFLFAMFWGQQAEAQFFEIRRYGYDKQSSFKDISFGRQKSKRKSKSWTVDVSYTSSFLPRISASAVGTSITTITPAIHLGYNGLEARLILPSGTAISISGHLPKTSFFDVPSGATLNTRDIMTALTVERMLELNIGKMKGFFHYGTRMYLQFSRRQIVNDINNDFEDLDDTELAAVNFLNVGYGVMFNRKWFCDSYFHFDPFQGDIAASLMLGYRIFIKK